MRRGLPYTLEGKLRKRNLVLRWIPQFSGRNLGLQSYRWKGGPAFSEDKTLDFSSCYFSYILWEKKIHFPLTSKYSRIRLVQKALWLSAFIYLPHIHSIGRILMLSWSDTECVTWVKDPSTVRFVCLNTSFLLTETLPIAWLDSFHKNIFTGFAVIIGNSGLAYTEVLGFLKGIPVTGNGRH